jgi:hypothetical protein
MKEASKALFGLNEQAAVKERNNAMPTVKSL